MWKSSWNRSNEKDALVRDKYHQTTNIDKNEIQYFKAPQAYYNTNFNTKYLQTGIESRMTCATHIFYCKN